MPSCKDIVGAKSVRLELDATLSRLRELAEDLLRIRTLELKRANAW